MTIPVGSRYPDLLDDDDNLYLVKDALRLRLSEDYTPGDTSINVEGDVAVLQKWPDVGLVTLTEQCSDIEDRAVSFFYNGIVLNDDLTGTFQNLELLPGFTDVHKMKRITNVTQNVMEDHHNQIKDALVAIQEFIGVKGTIDDAPFGDTLEGRINFLRKLVLVPKAWFTADKRIGIVPFEVEFKDLSFRLGTDGTVDPVILTWDFGDNTVSAVSLISVTSEVPDDAINVLVYDEDMGTVRKTYVRPGIFDVKLHVENEFGEDECIFPAYIQARVEAPREAVIRFRENSATQIGTPGTPPDGPFTVVPKIRSPINTLISFEIETGENAAQPGYSYSGELLDGGGFPLDPIDTYTWSFGDDLPHQNSREAQASYSVGGIYDLKLRVDTEFGAYRITTYEDSLDIVENVNLWLWTYQSSNTIRVYEYGLISQTFKLTDAATTVVTRDDSFLDNVPDSANQKKEFRKNVGFTARGTLPSGQKGSSLLYYATGRNALDSVSTEKINLIEFNGFLGTYIPRNPLTRPWGWADFNGTTTTYFIFGGVANYPLNVSPTNMVRSELNLSSLTANEVTMTPTDLTNATELQNNVAVFESDGTPTYGHYSTYRTAWKDSTGFMARNDGVGPFFRIKSFYKTQGTVGNPFQTFKKLQDIQGSTKIEGEMTDLIDGIYFFNNTGAVSRYDDTSGVWSSTGPGLNSATFRQLQDFTVEGFDSQTNTLFTASDSDRRAYLSYDYSTKAFLKFEQVTKTFSKLGSRPVGEQFVMGVY